MLTIIIIISYLVSGGSQYCECVLRMTHECGLFRIPVECSIQHNQTPLILYVQGYAEVQY